MFKKLTLGAVGLLLLVSPLVSSAQTTSAFQAQIDALLAQIKQLTALIAQLQGAQSATNQPTLTCFVPKYDLYIGKTDAVTNGDVKKLQLWLKNEGYFPDAQGTGYYGERTAEAVMRWQKAHGMNFVTTKSGVGKQTRAKMQEKCGSGAKIGNPYGNSYGLTADTSFVGSTPIVTAEFHGHFNNWPTQGTPSAYIDFGDGASVRVEKTVCPGEDCYFAAKHLYSKVGTHTITLHTIIDYKRVNLASTNIEVKDAGCKDVGEMPYIARIAPTTGPLGTPVEIWGCNFAGFEGDTDFIFEHPSGQKIVIDGMDSYRQSGWTSAKISVKEPCKAGETVYGEYSGLPEICKYTPLTTGTYSVYVNPWNKKSNVVNFTVTAQ